MIGDTAGDGGQSVNGPWQIVNGAPVSVHRGTSVEGASVLTGITATILFKVPLDVPIGWTPNSESM